VRILFAAHGFPPEERGGAELYVHELAHALTDLGHYVGVFAAHPTQGGTVDRIECDGSVDVERWFEPQSAEQALLVGRSAAAEHAFERALERLVPDVVHIHHTLFLSDRIIALSKRHSVPVVVSPLDFFFLCPRIHLPSRRAHRLRGRLWGVECFLHTLPNSRRPFGSLVIRGKLFRLLRLHLRRPREMRSALDRADRILAPSRFVRDRFLEFGCDPARTNVLPLGLPPAERVSVDREAAVRVGYVGAYVREKGADLLIAAFRRVASPGAKLILHGREIDASFAQELRRIAAQDPRVVVGDELPAGAVPAFLSGIDLLVVPTRLHETFSRIAREAFQLGVPVVASDAGVLPEIVTPHENGLLFRSGDGDGLSAALRALVDKPEGLAGLRRFPHVKTTDEHARELVDLYASLGHA
jgi:glycosyltransferase involved in cell wall biosynthesis